MKKQLLFLSLLGLSLSCNAFDKRWLFPGIAVTGIISGYIANKIISHHSYYSKFTDLKNQYKEILTTSIPVSNFIKENYKIMYAPYHLHTYARILQNDISNLKNYIDNQKNNQEFMNFKKQLDQLLNRITKSEEYKIEEQNKKLDEENRDKEYILNRECEYNSALQKSSSDLINFIRITHSGELFPLVKYVSQIKSDASSLQQYAQRMENLVFKTKAQTLQKQLFQLLDRIILTDQYKIEITEKYHKEKLNEQISQTRKYMEKCDNLTSEIGNLNSKINGLSSQINSYKLPH